MLIHSFLRLRGVFMAFQLLAETAEMMYEVIGVRMSEIARVGLQWEIGLVSRLSMA
jgi:hypothetical protein